MPLLVGGCIQLEDVPTVMSLLRCQRWRRADLLQCGEVGENLNYGKQVIKKPKIILGLESNCHS